MVLPNVKPEPVVEAKLPKLKPVELAEVIPVAGVLAVVVVVDPKLKFKVVEEVEPPKLKEGVDEEMALPKLKAGGAVEVLLPKLKFGVPVCAAPRLKLGFVVAVEGVVELVEPIPKSKFTIK